MSKNKAIKHKINICKKGAQKAILNNNLFLLRPCFNVCNLLIQNSSLAFR